MSDPTIPKAAARADMAPHPDARGPGFLGRRSFLGVVLGGSALVGLPAMGQTVVPELIDTTTQYFTPVEWQQIIVLCDALIPAGGNGPGALEARVPVFIDRQMAGAWGEAATWYMEGPHSPDADPLLGFQSPCTPAQIYRRGLEYFDAWCGKTEDLAFLDLDTESRARVIDSLMSDKVDFPPELRDFPDFLLKNTKEGYLSDPRHGGNHGLVAWSYIGFPGARGAFLPWTDPARDAMEYPLGPVAISGERG